jgi:hypothetical protein
VARLVGGQRVKLRGESPLSASSLALSRDSERPSKGKLTPALDDFQACRPTGSSRSLPPGEAIARLRKREKPERRPERQRGFRSSRRSFLVERSTFVWRFFVKPGGGSAASRGASWRRTANYPDSSSNSSKLVVEAPTRTALDL